MTRRFHIYTYIYRRQGNVTWSEQTDSGISLASGDDCTIISVLALDPSESDAIRTFSARVCVCLCVRLHQTPANQMRLTAKIRAQLQLFPRNTVDTSTSTHLTCTLQKVRKLRVTVRNVPLLGSSSLNHVAEGRQGLVDILRLLETVAQQRLLRQQLYFCNSKASKLSTCGIGSRQPLRPRQID